MYVLIERNVKYLTIPEYLLTMKNLAIRQYEHDLEFWDELWFPYLYHRDFNLKEVEEILKGIEFLKKKCINIDVDTPIDYLKSVKQNIENSEEFKKNKEKGKSEIKMRAEIPESEIKRQNELYKKKEKMAQDRKDDKQELIDRNERKWKLPTREERQIAKATRLSILNDPKDQTEIEEEIESAPIEEQKKLMEKYNIKIQQKPTQ